jgi:hypothetical protein
MLSPSLAPITGDVAWLSCSYLPSQDHNVNETNLSPVLCPPACCMATVPFGAAPMVADAELLAPQLAEEAGEWMLEGASHGIASVDCFELFGFPEDAPNLRDANSPGGL